MGYFYLFLVLSISIYFVKARHIREDVKSRIAADTVVCPEQLHNGIFWPASPAGPYTKVCPGNYTSTNSGKTTRKCNADGTWAENSPPCYPRIADSFKIDTSYTKASSANENGFTIDKYVKIQFNGDCQGLSNDILKVMLKYNYTDNHNYTFKELSFKCGDTIEITARDDEKDKDISTNKMDMYLEIVGADMEIFRIQIIFGCIPDTVDFTSFNTYTLKDTTGIGICLNDTISTSKPNRKCKINGEWDNNIINGCFNSIDTNILKYDDSKINKFIENNQLCFNGAVLYNFPYDCDETTTKARKLSLYYQTKSNVQTQIDNNIDFKCQKTIEFKIDQSKCFDPSTDNIGFFLLKSDNAVVIQNISFVLGCNEIRNDMNDNWDVSLVGEISGKCNSNSIANSPSGKPIRECSGEDGNWKIPSYRCIKEDYKDLIMEINENSVTMENEMFYFNNIKLNNKNIEKCVKGNKISFYYNYINLNDNNKNEEKLFKEITYNCEQTLQIEPTTKISFKSLEIQHISITMKLSSDSSFIGYLSIPLGCSSQLNVLNSNFKSSSLYLHEITGECKEGTTTTSISNPYPKAICKMNNKLEITNPCYYDINHIEIDSTNVKTSLKDDSNFCLNGNINLLYESTCSDVQPTDSMLSLYYYYENNEDELNLLTQTQYQCKQGLVYSYTLNNMCLKEVKYSKIHFLLQHSDKVRVTSSSLILGCPMMNINKYILPISTPTITNKNDSTVITYVDGKCLDNYNYILKPIAACNEYGEWENYTGICYKPTYTGIAYDLSKLKFTSINNELSVSGYIKLYQNSTCDDQPIELPLELYIKIDDVETLIYKFNYICQNGSEIGNQVIENRITQNTNLRMATLLIKFNNENVNELNIYVACPAVVTTTSSYPETNPGEISTGNCIGDYTSKSNPTRLCNIDGTWSESDINDNCKIESFLSQWGGLIFGLIGGAILILLLSCGIVYWFHRKHISHWKSEVEEMDRKWKEHNDGQIQKVEFNTTTAKKISNPQQIQQSHQQQPNLFTPDQSNNINNPVNNVNPSTLFPKNTWLKQQVEVGYDDDDDDEYYEDDEEGEYEEGDYYEEEEEEKEVGENERENEGVYYEENVHKATTTHHKKKPIVNSLEKIDEEEDEGDDEFNY